MQVPEELVVSKDHMQIIKGKRTKRQRAPSPLRLAMPSTSCTENSGGLVDQVTTTTSPTNTIGLRDRTEEEEDMANCLILLAQGHHHHNTPVADHNTNKSSLYLYQCKTCDRCFPSFQALGGHRASHKKPKANGNGNGTEEKQAITTFVNEEGDHYDPTTTNTILSLQMCSSSIISTTTTTTKSKVHECSICGAEFSSGQALGGHMRRHRTLANKSITGGGSPESQEAKKPRKVLKLDLNLPAPEDDHRESKFSFPPRENNIIVFSKSSLVDCHY